MDVFIIMALILVPVTALLSFLGYKFISYYEIVREPPSVKKWIIGTITAYIVLMVIQLLRRFVGDIMSGTSGAFIIVALVLAPVLTLASYLAYIDHHKFKKFAPISMKTWIIMTVMGYVIILIALIHHILNSGPTTM